MFVPGMVVDALNPSTQKTEAGRALSSRLARNRVRPCSDKQTKQNKKLVIINKSYVCKEIAY